MKAIADLLGLAAILFFALAQVSAIGYIIYHWAFVTTFAIALWGGFVLWLSMLGASLILLTIGAILHYSWKRSLK